MPIQMRCLFTSLIVVAAGLTGSYAMATDSKGNAPTLPSSYRLADVSVRITQSPGRAASTKNQVLKLTGAGNSSLEKNGPVVSFPYDTKAMLAVVNELYRTHFFDLPSNYGVSRSVVLKDDGTLITQFLKMTDAPSTTVCFSLPSFEKCVTYGLNGPQELDAMVRRWMDEAEQSVKSASTPK